MSRNNTIAIWAITAILAGQLGVSIHTNYFVEDEPPEPRSIDWSDVPQLEVEVTEFTANSRLYDDVDQGRNFAVGGRQKPR